MKKTNNHSKSKKENMGKSAKKKFQTFLNYPFEMLVAILMILGIILSFFSLLWGGVLVGLAIGLYFSDEIAAYFAGLRTRIAEEGLFKTLLRIGLVVFLLLAIPQLIVAAAIGFGIMALVNRSRHTKR